MSAISVRQPSGSGDAKSIVPTDAAPITRHALSTTAEPDGHGTPLLKEGRFTVTPGLAAQILQRFHYDAQNPRAKTMRAHVEVLAAQMREKTWTPGMQLAFGVLPDQTVRLVNGYQRLHALIAADLTIEFQLLLVPVKDEAALWELYYRFDTVQRVRSDAAIVAATGIADRIGIPREIASRAYTAGGILHNGLRVLTGYARDPYMRTPDGKLKAVQPWWEYVEQYAGIMKPAERTLRLRLTSASVMAVALATLRYQNRRATEFWEGVAANTFSNKGDPRQALVTKLLATSFQGQHPDAALNTAATAWNHWYRNEYREKLVVNYARGCRVLGTPFAGRAT